MERGGLAAGRGRRLTDRDLAALLGALAPELLRGTYVFCTLPGGTYGDLGALAPLASFSESEGLTLVLTRAAADAADLSYEGAFSAIKLGVFSSLEAVGLTAAVSSALAARGISANVIAAYHHDYVFVPQRSTDVALRCLAALSAQSRPDEHE